MAKQHVDPAVAKAKKPMDLLLLRKQLAPHLVDSLRGLATELEKTAAEMRRQARLIKDGVQHPEFESLDNRIGRLLTHAHEELDMPHRGGSIREQIDAIWTFKAKEVGK